MHGIKIGLLIVAFTLLSNGSPLLAKMRSQYTPIIFAPTGHKSCKRDAYGRKDSPYNTTLHYFIEKLVEEVKEEYLALEPRVIYACFDYEKLQFGGQLHFKWTKEDKKIGQVNLGKWVLFEKIDWEYIQPAVEAISNYIEEIASQVENPKVYLFGHSWGGWLNMKLATTLPLDIPVEGLLTLDPLSPLDCWPNLYIRLGPNYIKSCFQAPTDIDIIEQQHIMHRVKGNWQHYYQSQFVFMSSGPIDLLEEGVNSFKITFKRRVWQFHHGAVQNDERAWIFAKNVMLQSL